MSLALSKHSTYRKLRPYLQTFVRAVLVGENPTAVARKMRPNLQRPKELACRWMARADVKAALAECGGPLLERVGITVEMIARHLGLIAFGDPRRLFDATGQLLPIHELDEEAAAMVSGIEVEALFEGQGEARKLVGRLHKIKRWDKRQALNDLATIAGIRRNDQLPPASIGPGLTVVVQQYAGGGVGPQQAHVVVNLPPPA